MNRVIVLSFLSLAGCATNLFTRQSEPYDSYLLCGETKLHYFLSLSDENSIKLHLKDGESDKLTPAIPYATLNKTTPNSGLYEFKKTDCVLKRDKIGSLTKSAE